MTCESLGMQRHLYGNQQVVRQDTQKDMRFHPVLEVMENGTLGQGALHATEGVLGACREA